MCSRPAVSSTRKSNPRRHPLELIDRRRSVDVRAGEQRSFRALLQPQRQLPGEGGLARALKARQQDDRRQVLRTGERDRGLPEQALQLVANDPHHLLPGGEAAQHVPAHRPGLDPSDKVACHSDLNVGLKQGPPHLPKALAHVVGGETGLARQLLEYPLQSVAKRFEHGPFPSGEAGTIAQGWGDG